MNRAAETKAAILRLLLSLDGTPATTGQIVSHVQMLLAPRPTESDVTGELTQLESAGLVTGATDEVFKTVTWSLTTKGAHKARQL